MFRSFSIALISSALALPVASFAQTSAEPAGALTTAVADACVLQLGYEATAADVVVVGPRGAGSIALNTIDAAKGGTAGRAVEVVAFDMAGCALVETKVWVQDSSGKEIQEGPGPVTRLDAVHFNEGVNYVRANLGLNRDIGFLVRYVN